MIYLTWNGQLIDCYKSESAFCGEAIEEYLAKLQYDSIGTYMNKLLVQAVDSTIAGHIDRIVDMLYKLARQH